MEKTESQKWMEEIHGPAPTVPRELIIWAESTPPTIGEYGRGYEDARAAVLRILKDSGVA